MRKLAFIGTGYVGLVSGAGFAEAGNHVVCCDVNPTRIESLNKGIMPFYEPGLTDLVQKNLMKGNIKFTTDLASTIKEAEIIFITVGTPMLVTGEADLTYVKQVAQTISENMNGYKIIVTKSTVPVGAGKLIKEILLNNSGHPFDLVSNPEFLREGTAVSDMMAMERTVIGTSSNKAFEVLEKLHAPFTSNIVRTTIETSELIKYAANAFLAIKISFINDIANICEAIGGDVTLISQAVGLDSRIGSKFLNAGVGFGGSCFPKDTEALLHIARACDYDFKLVKAAIETNENQRRLMIEKLISVLGTLDGKVISVLGLAFKPNTSDVRSSPALDIIPVLTKLGAKVKAFDPVASEEARKLLGDQCSYSTNLYETVSESDACLILTEWQDVKEINWYFTKEVMNQPIIVDGRNLFELNAMRELGFTYLSVGRPSVYSHDQEFDKDCSIIGASEKLESASIRPK